MSTELNDDLESDLGVLRFYGGVDRGVCFTFYDKTTDHVVTFTTEELLGIVNNWPPVVADECFTLVDKDGDVWAFNEKANCWELCSVSGSHFEHSYTSEAEARGAAAQMEFESWSTNPFVRIDKLEGKIR